MNRIHCAIGRVLVVMGVIFTGLWGSKTAAQLEGRQTPAKDKVVLMHYMPWYETPAVRGRWGAHWTGHEGQHNPGKIKADGLPDIWSHFHPMIGLYDSADPAVLECQLLQMKLAGVDGVIADWYGIADAADYPPIHRATAALIDAAAKVGMSFAVCYEDRTVQLLVDWKKITKEEVAGHLSETFAWLGENWFGRANYLRHDGRPVVLNFGPIYVTDGAAWEGAVKAIPEASGNRPVLYGLHHLWKGVGADGGFTWVHKEAVGTYAPGDEVGRREALRKLLETFLHAGEPGRVIASAYPGFRDVYAQPHPVMDYRDGQTLRDGLEVAMNGPWPMVQLVTWNDYGEGTMIEPTHEFGYKFLEIVQEFCRPAGAAGQKVTAEDLRLPARLLQLRRGGGAVAGELDEIAQMLARGDVAGARSKIEGAGG